MCTNGQNPENVIEQIVQHIRRMNDPTRKININKAVQKEVDAYLAKTTVQPYTSKKIR